MQTDIDWSDPDYSKIFSERRDRLIRLRGMDAGELSGVRSYYKERPVEFITDWGCTFDPRNPERGLPALVPFILFERQVEFVEWLHARWLGQEDGLAEKSRDMGVSWLCVAFGVWMWCFYEGSVVGFGSRKEEYVDKLGDPKSLFWKAREFIKYLPVEFRPGDFNERRDAPYMRIMNRENDSVLVGEAGTNIGRGNRTSIYFVDEAAFLDKPESIDAALSQTSNCKIHVSTPNGNGNPFYRKRMGGVVPVFTFSWQDDPRKDKAWYREQKSKLDPVIVAQEIDLDYQSSASRVYMDGEAVIAAQNNTAMDVEAQGPWMIGVDAAHEGNDNSVIHKRRGRFNADQTVIRGKTTGIELAGAVEAECDTLIEAGGAVGQIVIELDGPGVSCYDQLKAGRYGELVRGVHTGARLKNNRDYNLRALLWRTANEYLQEGGALLPRDPELKAELCSMQATYKDGMLLMQSKKDYKSSYGKSCDKADAFILTHYPYKPKIYKRDNDPFARAREPSKASWMAV